MSNLPSWDLSDFYLDINSPQIKKDMSSINALCSEFKTAYEGTLHGLSSEQLSIAIIEYEQIQELIHKLYSYAHLVYVTNMEDEEVMTFFQNTCETLDLEFSKLIFFSLELNDLEEEELEAHKENNAKVAHYEPFLKNIRVFKPYQLTDELERLLHEKSITGKSAWIRLFDEKMSALEFPYRDKTLISAEIFNLLSSKDGEERKDAAQAIAKVLKDNIKQFAFIYNTLVKDKAVEDGWRGFNTPISSRNISNFVEDEVVENLIISVQDRYHELSHRYYQLKAKWLGVEKLNYWDRNAPLPEDDSRKYSWEEAKKIVLEAYNEFSPEIAELVKKFFDNNWIDAGVKKGKDSGAFAHPTVPSVHPYILMNFQGKARDVMTLAHELGHGVHQLLAGKQGTLMSDTPLTLAETASVFGEQLTFRKLLAGSDEKTRKVMIANKIEDMLNTVVRQTAFCEFESRVHYRRQNGELTANQICDIWMETQQDSLGDGFDFDEEYKYYWSYIPHFIHTPFYVYAYAFGDCLVNALYAVYEKAEDKEAFVDKYIRMLEAGGTLGHKELLAPFGLDASHPNFWNKGLDIISGLIDEIED